jgi:penicillin-binding protein 1A
MIGGKNFRKVKCNLATADGTGQNCGTGRQTGSAFKMFTIAAAVANGVSLRSTFAGPGRVVLKGHPECSPWDTRGVSNYSDSGSGTMDLIGATARSVNTIFAQLVAEVGPQKVVDIAHKLGIESPLDPVCGITLGTEEVSPLEMTTSFATIAAGGVRHDATPIHEVKSSDGETLFQTSKKGERVLKPNQAWQVATALRAVVTGGTGTAANLPGVEVIGKTGTSEGHANAYFCGTTRILTTCVWVGYKKGNIPMTSVHGISVTGGSFPARIWRSFMEPIHAGRNVPGFPTAELTGKRVKGDVKIVKDKKPKKKKKSQNVGGVVPTTPPPPPPPPPTDPACSDGADNDGDGATDFPSDLGCTGPDDNDESGP